jgi:hypothetical protein
MKCSSCCLECEVLGVLRPAIRGGLPARWVPPTSPDKELGAYVHGGDVHTAAYWQDHRDPDGTRFCHLVAALDQQPFQTPLFKLLPGWLKCWYVYVPV